MENAGQQHRLTLPASPPLSDIHAEIAAFAKRLDAYGVRGFFLSFAFPVKRMSFHISCLYQADRKPARDAIHDAALQVVEMQDMIYMTAEGNELTQPFRYTTPTLKE